MHFSLRYPVNTNVILRNAAKNNYILSESEKLYKTLFNSISHELRIPVATILGASDTLLSQNYPEETRQKLYTEISIASVRLNRLIENLLNMSRLESGHITPKPDWCDVHDLANEVAETLQVELKPFKLSTIIPADMPLVMTDFGLVEQVMHNLILNATQYAPAGSRIRLKIFYDNGFLNIQVMDRGPGFSPSELNFVFDKFYRGKDSKPVEQVWAFQLSKACRCSGRNNYCRKQENGGAKFIIKIPVKLQI